jgi:predicted transcriptional regulator
MEFQKKNKMIATGIVDNVTFSAIMSIGGKKIVKENLSSRTGELYSGINELIDREFDDVEPSEVVRILSNILKHHEGKVYRKKHNINPISKDEVLRNFKRF